MRALIFAVLAASLPVSAGPNADNLKTAHQLVKRILPDTFRDQDCGNSDKARALAALIMADSEQRRPRLVCNPVLTRVAEQKALEMAEKGMVTHFASNVGANTRLRQAGYRLPDTYPSFYENQVEAVAGGYSTPDEVWREFKGSTVHRTHLLGEQPFFREQDEIGVAFVRKWESPHVEYWAVYIARQE